MPAPTRRALLGAAPLPAAAPRYRVSSDSSDDPLFMSATKLAGLIRAGQLSASEAVRLHIARIEALHPRLNAVVARCFERALYEAREADAAQARGKPLGPLHGVPMTIKDSFDTEGLVSTGGTLGRAHFIPGQDATVVARVRAAGAILLGKTNTPEFTLGVGPRGTDNLVYGVTRNPYHPDYQPGASSGGSAANVAAGGASFDLGSDFYGSIRDPAHACGVVGLKPTHGRVPRTGHIIGYGGAYDSFQGIGPLVRRVEDLALLLPIIAGPDARDAAVQPVPLGDADAVDLRGLRVAVYATNGENPPSAEIQELVRRCAQSLAEAGCRVREDMPPKMGELAGLRGAYSGAAGGYLTRSLLQRAGTATPYPSLPPASGDELPSADFTRYAEELDAVRSEQLAWFEQYDLILCPASTRAALPIGERPTPLPPAAKQAPAAAPAPRRRMSPYYLGIYNTNGWPAGVVRAGSAAGEPALPVGVQLIARPWREDQLIAALRHIEAYTGGYRRPPI
ncbi:amidase [Solimonas variicoloris]|uniref:amidase n=1 Tax=Solimonas variicoloris TaxID=254408 RepID=UPI00036E5511|nr:amidase [Solimonas variicoloris]